LAVGQSVYSNNAGQGTKYEVQATSTFRILNHRNLHIKNQKPEPSKAHYCPARPLHQHKRGYRFHDYCYSPAWPRARLSIARLVPRGAIDMSQKSGVLLAPSHPVNGERPHWPLRSPDYQFPSYKYPAKQIKIATRPCFSLLAHLSPRITHA